MISNTMDKELLERLEELANDVVGDIDNFVPVIGNLLYTCKDGSGLYPDFKSFFDKKNNDTYSRKGSIVIKDSVIDFLEKGKFKLILTTSPFDVLDKALKDKGVPIKTYYHRWSQNESTNKIERQEGDWSQEQCQKNGIIGEKDVLVYHLLGGKKTNNLPETERDFLECLVSYQMDKSNSLPEMLREKQILLLGSGIPNWLFLLLWYPLMRTSGWRYLFNNKYDKDDEFNSCLNSLHFDTLQAMEEFLSFAIKKLTPSTQSHSIQRDFKYDVFLSYKSKDKPFADKIYNHLTYEHHLDVWYMEVRKDKDNPGEYYNRILDGIIHSRTFMPVISYNYFTKFLDIEPYKSNSKNPLKEDMDSIIKKDFGLITETFMALKMKNEIQASTGLDFYVIPVWDMDKMDAQTRSFVKKQFNELNIFQEVINEYSYTDDKREIAGLKSFQSFDWHALLKR